MQFTCKTDEFKSMLKTASDFTGAESKNASGIMLEAKENFVTIRATDLSIWVEFKIPAIVEEEGPALLNGKTLAGIVGYMAGEEIEFKNNLKKIGIKSGNDKANMLRMVEDDFPALEAEKYSNSIKLPETELREMITITEQAAEEASFKTLYSAVAFSVKDKIFRTVAVNNKRMSISQKVGEYDIPDVTAIIPGKRCDKIRKVLGAKGKDVELCFGERTASFNFDGGSVTTLLIQEKYFDYFKFLDKIGFNRYKVNKNDFQTALEAVSVVMNDKTRDKVKISISDGLVALYGVSELGEISRRITLSDGSSPAPLEINFSTKNILTVVRTCRKDILEFLVDGSMMMCTFDDDEDNVKATHMIMPMRA